MNRLSVPNVSRRRTSRPWAWPHTPLQLPHAQAELAGGPCVVHLVRKANGLGALRGFADALRSHPPGIEHELVLAMKGFHSAEEAKPYLREVADLEPRTLFFSDRGFDLGVYFATAARLRRERYCFLNSNARPLVDGWLAMLNKALNRPGVGQVGATGAGASGHSWFTYSMGLPSAYRGLLPPLPTARELLLEVELEKQGKRRRSFAEMLHGRLKALLQMPEELFDFGAFPTVHLRPNSFMITHAILRELRLFVVLNKMDTYTIESGRESLTRQLEKLGRATLVVDRDGAVHPPERWGLSRTFWQSNQEHLLIADNQTLYYAHGDDARRRLLSRFAWGEHADPAPARLSRREAALSTAARSAASCRGD